jgi:TolB protein
VQLGELWTIDANGSNARALTSAAAATAVGPSWSPDGRWIAYTARDGVHVLTSDGARDLLVLAGVGSRADWSPDSRRLIVAAGDVFAVVSIDDSVVVARLRIRQGSGATWSPDGTTIIFSRPKRSRNSHKTVACSERQGRMCCAGRGQPI